MWLFKIFTKFNINENFKTKFKELKEFESKNIFETEVF